MQYRIGQGFDIHKLVENRKLIIGGIEIDYHKGLLGHSDADVLMHSITDALLGALALGDIGTHFPDTDPIYKDVNSAMLLKDIYNLVKSKGYIVNNIDNTIQIQEPKMKHYMPLMQRKIAEILEIEPEQISIKAKTMEGLGEIGRSEAIAAQSIVLISKIQ